MPQQLPPDQAKQIYRNIGTKPLTAVLKDGVLTIEIDYGYSVTFKMQPFFGINTTRPWMKNQKGVDIPEFQTAFNMAPMAVDVLPGAKTRDEILEALKSKTVIPQMEFDNFTVGFVYANADNPQNHKWMLEFRKNKNIFHAMHFLGCDIDCPFSTTSWHDGIYHGRFQVNKEAFKQVLETDKPGWISITGNNHNKHRPKGDVKLLPVDAERVRFRFNVKTDYWYGDFLDKNDKAVSQPLKMHDILGEDIKLTGHVDWDSNPAKPRVMFHVNCKDVRAPRSTRASASTERAISRARPSRMPRSGI